ncbi:MAG TPA: hypothetical protein VFW59_07290, partial [Gallionella sp.]|nr:hypothetical protein [Gallionella sp.]
MGDLGEARCGEKTEALDSVFDLLPGIVSHVDFLAPTAHAQKRAIAFDVGGAERDCCTQFGFYGSAAVFDIPVGQQRNAHFHIAAQIGRIAPEGQIAYRFVRPHPLEQGFMDVPGFRIVNEIPQRLLADVPAGHALPVIGCGEQVPLIVEIDQQIVLVYLINDFKRITWHSLAPCQSGG